ncbi:ABC transporter substrate-binding protein [Feifania hominis]|uniref:ABC transporter substrate-binding protein n=1 Tax=Feifania hominis TaxID=2763660 RepID=A0A926HUJ4_9FIRM|nr:ABC transporter substrate-binding protein [Feifania hominis]MBC8536358.1 ABC transporter substrate-binding protein [Feifania hominis]
MLKGNGKKWLAILLATVMLAAVFVGCKPAQSDPGTSDPGQSGTENQFDGEIVLGACSDLSGSGASNGEGEAKAYQMVADMINAEGGVMGKKLVIKQEDTQGTVEGSVNAINRQFSDKNVVGVFGFMYSSQVMGISDIAKEAGRPVLYGGSSPSIWELNNPWLFRMRPNDQLMVTLAVEYVFQEMGAKKLGMIYSMDDYGTQAYEVAKGYCEKNGKELIADGYTVGAKDYYSQLLTLKNAGCDTMLLWGHEEEYAILVRQRLELDYNVPVFGSNGIGNPDFNNLVSTEESEGIVAIGESCPGNQWEYFTEFEQQYKAKFNGESPNNNVCSLVPAIYLYCDAIERAQSTDPAKVAEALRETKDFPAITGYLTCDSNQDFCHSGIVYEMKNGERSFIDLFSVDPE